MYRREKSIVAFVPDGLGRVPDGRISVPDVMHVVPDGTDVLSEDTDVVPDGTVDAAGRLFSIFDVLIISLNDK